MALFEELVVGKVIATDDVSVAGTLAVSEEASLDGGLNLGSAVNHDYASAHADWTLTAAQQKATFLTTTDDSADAGVNAIATATDGKVFHVKNTCGQILTIKASGQTGVAIANDRQALVRGNGTDFVKITTDMALT